MPTLRASAPPFPSSSRGERTLDDLSSSASRAHSRVESFSTTRPKSAPKRPPLPAQLLCADTLSSTTNTLCLLPGGEGTQRVLLCWPQTAPGAPSGQQHIGQAAVALEFIPSTSYPVQAQRQNQQNRREQETGEAGSTQLSPSKQLLLSLKHSAKMACCFCCCPVYRCVLWFCALELICSIYLWYSELSELVRTYSAVQLKDILILMILSGWLITLCVSTFSLFMAQRKGDPQWVLPRLVQQSGLLLLSFLMALLLVLYFAGGAQAINNLLIAIYEKLYSDPIGKDQRQGVHEDLRFYFLLSILFNFASICYLSAALCATKKYYRELQVTGGRRFQPVNQHDPTAPPRQPPVNPYYKGSFA